MHVYGIRDLNLHCVMVAKLFSCLTISERIAVYLVNGQSES